MGEKFGPGPDVGSGWPRCSFWWHHLKCGYLANWENYLGLKLPFFLSLAACLTIRHVWICVYACNGAKNMFLCLATIVSCRIINSSWHVIEFESKLRHQVHRLEQTTQKLIRWTRRWVSGYNGHSLTTCDHSSRPKKIFPPEIKWTVWRIIFVELVVCSLYIILYIYFNFYIRRCQQTTDCAKVLKDFTERASASSVWADP